MKIVALVLAVLCFVLSGLYGSGHFPHDPKMHPTHAVAFALVGLLALVWYRIQGASSSAPRA